MRFILWSAQERVKAPWMLPISWNLLWLVEIWERLVLRLWMNTKSISRRIKPWNVVSRLSWLMNRMSWMLFLSCVDWRKSMKTIIRSVSRMMLSSRLFSCQPGIFRTVSCRIRRSTWWMKPQLVCVCRWIRCRKRWMKFPVVLNNWRLNGKQSSGKMINRSWNSWIRRSLTWRMKKQSRRLSGKARSRWSTRSNKIRSISRTWSSKLIRRNGKVITVK